MTFRVGKFARRRANVETLQTNLPTLPLAGQVPVGRRDVDKPQLHAFNAVPLIEA
jgi:hypothetical protein